MTILDPGVNLCPMVRMRGMAGIGTAQAVDALMSWWALAGVDTAVDEAPVNWLRPKPSPRRAAASSPASPPEPIRPALPDTLESFHAWLAAAADLPEAAWNDRRVLPVGPAAPRLMIVTDLPEMDDMHAGALFAGDQGRLLDAMLRAMGFARDAVHIASLAVTRPPGGLVEERTEAALADRMRHHIRLVAPASVLLLGERTGRALQATDVAARPAGLSSLNHAGGTVPAIATFHPRLLLRQPHAKAECWRALQLLVQV